ncbi:MAG: lipopolysaccharide transport system permease protein [Chloroflexia bacterium]|nr:lipopolysaccharide transport system permease protein [Chloroflexia bacterium]
MIARARQSILYRDLLYNLVVRDLKVRYKHSFLGFFWSLLNPLLLMAVFTFVFTTLLGQNGVQPMYHIFFLCALLPWNWCATSTMGTLGSIVNNGHLIKKVYFPREFLPFSVVVSNMINYLLSLPALLLFMLLFRSPVAGDPFSSTCNLACINAHLLWLPLLILTQTVFLVGLGFFLSALNVFFRDTSVLVEVGLNAWFFLTPIIYDVRSLTSFPTLMYYLNPMASIITNYRDIFYHNQAGSPDLLFMLRTLVECTIILLAGYLFFMRTSRSFGEEV